MRKRLWTTRDGARDGELLQQVVVLLSGTATVIVPCWMRCTYDLPLTPTTVDGIDVFGRLYVPPNHKSTFLTKSVFV